MSPCIAGRVRGQNVLLVALLACMVVVLVGCGSATQGGSSEASGASASATSASSGIIESVADDDPYGTGVHHVAIEVEGYGTIEVALNANVAPITVSNFCRLANEGFYDGLTFHRVISGFMIQGGDPNGDGTGGSGQCILGEFSANNVKNNLPHTRGTISMARSQTYNSASSQFFIMQKDTDSLNGKYAAFGNVTSGMDVVDSICENTPTTDSNGTVPKESQPKISKITVTD